LLITFHVQLEPLAIQNRIVWRIIQLLRHHIIPAIAFTVLLAAQEKPDIQVNVDLVTVASSVSDRSNAPVRNLTLADFNLSDNGQPRQIRNVWQESDLPLTVALVADASGSQAGYIEEHRQAIAQFLKQVIGPRDRAMIVQVAQQAWLISDVTGSPEALDAAVAKIGTHQGKRARLVGPPCRNVRIPHSCGGTALWHGLYHTAMAMRVVTGRKAIVVLSDGIDTGSDLNVTDVIQAAQLSEAVVYSIKYSSPASFVSVGTLVAEAVSHGLERLDRETGGQTFPNPGKKIPEVFSRIESDLRNMYVLGFTPPAEVCDGKFHKLEVKTVRANLVVRSRAGYWAPNAR
jgi:VWFA-related protein